MVLTKARLLKHDFPVHGDNQFRGGTLGCFSVRECGPLGKF